MEIKPSRPGWLGMRLLGVAVWVILAATAQAAFLRDVPQTVTQPDGSVVHLFASGDEYYNRLHDAGGYTVVRDPDTGYLVYAVKADGQLLPSGLVVSQVDPAALGLQPNLLPDARFLPDPKAQYPEGWRLPVRAQGLQSAPAFSQINNIVVFIRFSDETDAWQAPSVYDGWFNATGSGATSMKAFFLEASYGLLAIDSGMYPTSSGSTVISYQDSHPRAYYKPYNAKSNPQGYLDSQRGQREHILLGNAINAISGQVPDTLNVDSNNDGLVDSVVFIVSGAPMQADWSNLLWPHKWSMSSDYAVEARINGKLVEEYDLQLDGYIHVFGNGVLCHEMTHTLGAPDLYRYSTCSSDSSLNPVGPWDLMANNKQPPQHMGAYLKWRYLGFIADVPTITTSGTYQLHPLTSSSNNCYKIASPNSPDEYFLLEYRKKVAPFEISVPGSGLLVYRIDTTADGQGNACGPPDEEYVYRPTGSLTSDGIINQAAFSAEVARTAISDTTDPSSFLSTGGPGGLSISGIGSAGDTISFTVSVQPACVPGPFALVSPANGAALPAATTSAQLTWSAAPNVTSYDVYFGSTDNPPLFGNYTGTTTSVTVANGQSYFWKVLAKNSCGPAAAPSHGSWAFTVGGTPGVVTLFSDDFEDSFPGKWQLASTASAGPTAWGKVSCKTAAGNGAAWCAAGGNAPQSPCSKYVPSMGTFMMYGPFSLADAVEGSLDFDLWADINDGGNPADPTDIVYWMFSLDGQDFTGDGFSGTSNGWQHESLPLSQVLVGDVEKVSILGHSKVWFAFIFISSDATTPREGAYVDNVAIKKMTSAWCTFSLAASSQAFPATGGSGSVEVTSSGSTCPWTAMSDVPWITLSSGASGAGNGTVAFSVAANSGAVRTGALTIAGQTFTVNQAAPCTFALSAASQDFGSAGGTGSVGVTTAGSTCPWTAVSDVPWITISSGASGAGNGTVTLSVAANSGAARTGTLTIAGQTFTVNQSAAATSRWLPSVIHKDVPSRNAWWRSDAAVLNLSSSTANVKLTILAPSGTKAQTMQVGASSQVLLHDVAGQLGIAADSGAMKVESDQPFLLTSRTYSQVDATHTYGQDYIGQASSDLLAAGQTAWLPQLTQNAYYRSNVGITNTGTTTANVTVTTYDASGNPAGWSDTRDYAPGQFYQHDQPFLHTPAGAIDSGYVVVTVNSGSGVAASASVIDQQTGDPTTIDFKVAASAGTGIAPQWLPSVIHKDVPSRNAWWRSDAALLNLGGGIANVTLTILAPSGTKTQTMQVGANSQALLHDVAGQLGITADSGAMKVESDQPFLLTSRTYSQVDATHTYGQDYIGQASSELLAAGQTAWLPQLTQNAYYRSNVGITNTGTTTANVTVTTYDASGNPAGWSDTRDYAPGQFYQHDQPFLHTPAGAIDSGYVVVTVNSGSGVAASASVIDQQTGDPTTIKAQR
ncbi:MAG: M6 family metalloprotease domain-containing protein [Thermoanaerobaculales bacterium]